MIPPAAGLFGEVINRAPVRIAQLGGDEFPSVTGGSDVSDHGSSPRRIPTRDDDEGTLGGQHCCDGHFQTAGGSGDKCSTAVGIMLATADLSYLEADLETGIATLRN